jgi:hypothetical protein
MIIEMNFYSDKKYANILNTVAPHHYLITTSEDLLSKQFFPDLKMPFVGACVSTGGTTQVTLYYKQFQIPEGSRIPHLRWFREDNQISKAYDIILIPIKSGDILIVSWKEAIDHHKPLLEAGGLEGLIKTNHLPSKKSGHLSEYGAYVPTVIDFATQENEGLKIVGKQK